MTTYPTQAHNPNSIPIGSAIFAQLTAERPYTFLFFSLFATGFYIPVNKDYHTSQRATLPIRIIIFFP